MIKSEFSLRLFTTFGFAALFVLLGVLNSLFLYGVLLCVIFYFSLEESFKLIKNKFFAFIYSLIGVVSSFLILYFFDHKYLLLLVLLVSSVDAGGYIFGKLFGKTKFSKYSPKKTIEGIVGGVLLSLFIGGTYFVYLTDNIYLALITTLIICVTSVYGDLFESYLKRKADVKDSGDILPGHGGMLDRIDGFVFSSPILFLSLYFFS